MAVLPNERCLSVAKMRAMATPETLHLVAEIDGELACSGLAGRSSFGYAGLHPWVVPDARRRGLGTAILERLATHAMSVGFTEAGTLVEDEGSMAFAERFGFREVDRQVEQVRQIGAEPRPDLPRGHRGGLGRRPSRAVGSSLRPAPAGGVRRHGDVPPDRRVARRRGLGSVLKRLTLALAAEHGVREVYTWTQPGNADMRA